MKRKDIATIVLVVGLSAIFSAIISNVLFGTPASRQQEAEVVSEISSEFGQPDPAYFNKDSINPTQIIRIGGESNNSPFGNEQP